MSGADGVVSAGEVLAGKYRVDRVLGQGGMGVVVAASHLQLRQRVAIKFLLPAAMAHPSAVERFLREARAAVRLKSEHVARVVDVGELETGAPYMVMEYLEGQDLAQVIREVQAVPIEQAVDYVLQACEAIAEAHSAGIIHRDLKPANLFLTKAADGSGIVKVLDFGISKVSEPEDGGMALTKTTALLGSPLYMAPEAMRSARNADEKTDQWALGVILFELISGRPPFEAESLTELVYKVMSENAPVPVLPNGQALPPALAETIARALNKDPALRFSSIGEFAWALADHASAVGKLCAEKAARILSASGVRVESPSRLPPEPLNPTTAAWSPATGEVPAGPPSKTRTLLLVAITVLGALGVFTVIKLQEAPPAPVVVAAPKAPVAVAAAAEATSAPTTAATVEPPAPTASAAVEAVAQPTATHNTQKPTTAKPPTVATASIPVTAPVETAAPAAQPTAKPATKPAAPVNPLDMPIQ